jgi:peptidoglycan/xylan/chitin deacetylase (PgdA/CDA1 family)
MKISFCYPEGRTKALTFSYDDGKEQDRRLVEIFNRYGLKATFNLNYGLLGKEPRLTAEQLKGLYDGHEVATHGLTHPTIARCPNEAVLEEILEDRKGLEQLFGQIVRGHAYPNGSYDERIKQILATAGIFYGRTVHSTGSFELPTDLMEWDPTCHHNDPKLPEYGKTLVEDRKSQYLRLLYVWGHSYEFDQNDNWDRIEEFCKTVSGKEDIWYATNMEIAGYLHAVQMLAFSADLSLVYNPTAEDLWIAVKDWSNVLRVPAGETIRTGI